MTHDELLARINANLCGKDGCDGEHYKKDNINGEWFALRAVVVLHRPIGKYCQRCSVNDWGQEQQKYPCKTIQAIEKELK